MAQHNYFERAFYDELQKLGGVAAPGGAATPTDAKPQAPKAAPIGLLMGAPKPGQPRRHPIELRKGQLGALKAFSASAPGDTQHSFAEGGKSTSGAGKIVT